ncbi:hypothetical protein PoB_004206200 [Plakobranchus ocellatus]|uniref:Uncharacterized protein n=1 Tax=Plakobranchus ocellatus TaxID=259542 RepID=A0AAV4B8V3_9GAST|nr:hypothetical protein PoB_004206200 [Plakobranchus ocellatus]
MEFRHSFDDYALSLRPKSKDCLRVLSEDLNYNPAKDQQRQKTLKHQKLHKQQQQLQECQHRWEQQQQHQRQQQQHNQTEFQQQHDKATTIGDLLDRSRPHPQLLQHHGQHQTDPQGDFDKMRGMDRMKKRKKSLLTRSQLSISSPYVPSLQQEQGKRKQQQKLTRQAVVEESVTGGAAGQRETNNGETAGGSGAGVEILDRVEQLTKQLVRVCVGKRNDSIDMGYDTHHVVRSPSKSSALNRKGRSNETKVGKKGKLNTDPEDNDGGNSELNLETMDVVEAPLKAFFLRRRSNTSSVRGGKPITGAPGEDAASLTVTYTEEQMYPWGRALEDAPWKSPIYSVKSEHRQRCTRCLTYFHFKFMCVADSGDEAAGQETLSHPDRGRKESHQPSLKRNPQSIPLQRSSSSAEPEWKHVSPRNSATKAQLQVRQSWTQYGQHSYDSRLEKPDQEHSLSHQFSSQPQLFVQSPGSETERSSQENSHVSPMNTARDGQSIESSESQTAPCFGEVVAISAGHDKEKSLPDCAPDGVYTYLHTNAACAQRTQDQCPNTINLNHTVAITSDQQCSDRLSSLVGQDYCPPSTTPYSLAHPPKVTFTLGDIQDSFFPSSESCEDAAESRPDQSSLKETGDVGSRHKHSSRTESCPGGVCAPGSDPEFIGSGVSTRLSAESRKLSTGKSPTSHVLKKGKHEYLV